MNNRLFTFIGLLVCVTPVFASISGEGLLNDTTNQFLTQSSTWGTTITHYASYLFWSLVVISMIFTFGFMALKNADIGEFLAEFMRFTIITGFFWWLLFNGPTIAMAIINSLREVGAQAGNLPNTLTPSTPISIGFNIVQKALSAANLLTPINNLAIVIISAIIMVCMAIVAANVLTALVTAWTFVYAGVFVLGFGGAKWTSDMAIGYFKAIISIGLELMTITLLIGVATSVLDGFYQNLDGSSINDLLLVVCVSATLALLIDKIPARVAGLVGSGSGANVGVGGIMSAVAMGAAAATTAGGAVVAAGAGAAGGASAIQAAFNKAMTSEAESGGGGMGGIEAMMKAASGSGDNGASSVMSAGANDGVSAGKSPSGSVPMASAGIKNKPGGMSFANSGSDSAGNNASANAGKNSSTGNNPTGAANSSSNNLASNNTSANAGSNASAGGNNASNTDAKNSTGHNSASVGSANFDASNSELSSTGELSEAFFEDALSEQDAVASVAGNDNGEGSGSGSTGFAVAGNTGESGSSNPASSNTAKFGRILAGTISNLAQGTFDVASESVKDRIGNTTGGRIAAAINNRQTPQKPDFFDDNSLSADVNNEPFDRDAEIAAFVNKNKNV